MVGIYIITNKLTKESYIGQSVDIERRWRDHKANVGKSKYNLYADMSFYGVDNFDFSVLELCEKSELDKREMYWIKKYQEDGYILYNIIGVHSRESIRGSRFRNKKTFKKY